MCGIPGATGGEVSHYDVGQFRVSIGNRYVELLEWVPDYCDLQPTGTNLKHLIGIPLEDAMKICKVVLSHRHDKPFVDPSIT